MPVYDEPKQSGAENKGYSPQHRDNTISPKKYDPRGEGADNTHIPDTRPAGKGLPEGIDPGSAPSDDNLDNIRDNEEQGAGGATGSEDENDEQENDSPDDNGGLLNEDGDKATGLFGGAKNRANSLKGFVSKHKFLVGGAAGGLGGLVALMLLLAILSSSLKLPTVMNSIQAYEFARVTQQFASTSEEVTGEALAQEATQGGLRDQIKERFTSKYQDIRKSTWGKLDEYRPEKVLQNLGQEGKIKLHYQVIGGRKTLTAFETESNIYRLKQPTGIAKWTPGLRGYLDAKNRGAVYRVALPEVIESMKARGTGALIRGAVADKIIKSIGGTRTGWVLSHFKNSGVDQEKNIFTETKDTYQDVEKGATNTETAKSGEIKDATQATKEQLDKDANDPAAVKKIRANNGLDAEAAEVAGKSFEDSKFKTALGIVNPAFAIAAPICIIYDGSVSSSQSTIDNNTNRAEHTFDRFAAQSAQQRIGSTGGTAQTVELENAIAATNAQIGDVSVSIPYARGNGSTIDTRNEVAPQAGASGDYEFTAIDALGVSGAAATGADFVANHFCGVLTSIPAAVGIGVLNLAAGIASGGTLEGGEEAAGQTARQLIVKFADTKYKQFTEKKTIERIGENGIKESFTVGGGYRAYRFAVGQGKVIAATIGLTMVAKIIVANKAGAATNGFAQDTDLVNQADAGGNIEAGRLCQRELFCRPLLPDEIATSDARDKQYVAKVNSQKSFTDRYFATSNYNSLITHMSISVGSLFSTKIPTTLTHLASMLMQPIHTFGSLITATGLVHADPDPSTQHYGLIQWGWSPKEEARIKENPDTYSMNINQEILDNSGQEAAIADKYAVCFHYTYDSSGNGSFDPSDPDGDMKDNPDGTEGKLLASGQIKRDSKSNVVDDDDALCSKSHLTYTSNEFGSEMVFRWRLAMRYFMVTSHLTNQQEVQNS